MVVDEGAHLFSSRIRRTHSDSKLQTLPERSVAWMALCAYRMHLLSRRIGRIRSETQKHVHDIIMETELHVPCKEKSSGHSR